MPEGRFPKRLEHVDVARGLALLAMATYHFSWDLEFFGYLEPGTANTGLLKIYARCIASTFLILAGMSLYWAHQNGFSRKSFTKRLLKVGGAAALITIATWFAMPDAFIFFGILHQITLASILGLAFIRLPALVTIAAAAFFIAAPHFLRDAAFNSWWLYWVGLSTQPPLSNDYVPVFPWFGAVLCGIAIASLVETFNLREMLASHAGAKNPVYKLFSAAGRHSLAIYLIHQPILIASVWAMSQIIPAPKADPDVTFINECNAICMQDNVDDSVDCNQYCTCSLENLKQSNILVDGQFQTNIDGYDEKVMRITEQCLFQSQ